MSIKKFFDKHKAEIKNDLVTLKADVNKLKTKAGAEAEALKKKIAEKANKVSNGVLYAELLPLVVAMNILLKKKGITGYNTKNVDEVAHKFFEVFVAPLSNTTNFEYASNFDTFVNEQLDKYGVREPKSNTEIAYHVDEATTQAMTMSTPEPKDKENQAGKTAGALLGTALMGAGIPIPPAVTSAIGSSVQNIIRGIVKFFKARKDNKDVKEALNIATKDLQGKTSGAPEALPTEDAPKKDNTKMLLYLLGAVVVVGILFYAFKKK